MRSIPTAASGCASNFIQHNVKRRTLQTWDIKVIGGIAQYELRNTLLVIAGKNICNSNHLRPSTQATRTFRIQPLTLSHLHYNSAIFVSEICLPVPIAIGRGGSTAIVNKTNFEETLKKNSERR